MRKVISYLLLFAFIGLMGCAKSSSCPTYDKNTGQTTIETPKKSKSSLFPKNMK